MSSSAGKAGAAPSTCATLGEPVDSPLVDRIGNQTLFITGRSGRGWGSSLKASQNRQGGEV